MAWLFNLSAVIVLLNRGHVECLSDPYPVSSDEVESYPTYDYDTVYPPTAQAERQDISVLGAPVLFMAAAAAFLGSLIAPAISTGVGRVLTMEFKLPELPFRALRYDLVDDRSLGTQIAGWISSLESLYEAGREILEES